MIGIQLFGKIPPWLRRNSKACSVPLKIAEGQFLGNRAKCCPQCFKERPYWPVEWEHILYTACHIHGVMLVSRCPACEVELQWNRPQLSRCKCGSSIEDWHTVAVTSDEREFCSYLVNCIRKDCGMPGEIGKNVLAAVCQENLTTNEFLAMTMILGMHCDLSRVGQRHIVHRPYQVEVFHKLNRLAAENIKHWPKYFHRYLKEAKEFDKEEEAPSQFSKPFINIKDAVYRRCSTPGLQFILSSFRAFVIENQHSILSRRQRWIEQRDIDNQRFMPGSVAETALQVSRARIKTLISKGVLQGYVRISRKKREMVVVDKWSMERAKNYLSDQISFQVAGRLLRLPRTRVEELVIGGHLTQYIDLSEERMTRTLSRKEILEFLSRLSKNRRASLPGEETIEARIILKNYLDSKNEFSALINEILNGGLVTMQTDSAPVGFADLVLSWEEFSSWRAQLRSRQITIDEAAIQLGIKQEVAYSLVRTGLLGSTAEDRGKRNCRTVGLEDIAQFQATYVSAAELAVTGGTSSKKILSSLEARGVRPVTGPSVDQSRQYFFCRADFKKA